MLKQLTQCANICAMGLFVLMTGVNAQNKPVTHVNVPDVPARPEDVNTIDGLVKASYETISGGVGVPRQWGRDRTLYDPSVRFVATSVDPKTGAIHASVTTHQEYVDLTDAFLVKDGFTESELSHKTYQFGNVATVLSSYEGKAIATGKVARGVNIFQLYYDGKRWRILSISWDDERPDNPIPADLLPKQ